MSNPKLERLAWPVQQGHIFSDRAAVLYCRAEGSYTHVHLLDGRTLLVSYKLGTVEAALAGAPFVRIHPSVVANLSYAQALFRQDGDLWLELGSELLPVAKTRRRLVLDAFFGLWVKNEGP